MVYSNKFVMCIIIDGKIQKELANGTVIIPFGSEYTIRFRNKNDRRAVVKFKIDGENASADGYVINANSFIDIKRYAHKDCAFKFVSLDSEEAIDFGKNGNNDDKVKGLIESVFYLEKQLPVTYTYNPSIWNNNKWPNTSNTYWMSSTTPCSWNATCDSHTYNKHAPRSLHRNNNSDHSGIQNSYPTHDLILNSDIKDGATVEGKPTQQNFYEVSIDLESDFVTLKLFLQGTKRINGSYPVHVTSDKENIKIKIEKENEDLRKQIEEQKKQKELDFLLKENLKLKEELEKLKNQ